MKIVARENWVSRSRSPLLRASHATRSRHRVGAFSRGQIHPMHTHTYNHIDLSTEYIIWSNFKNIKFGEMNSISVLDY